MKGVSSGPFRAWHETLSFGLTMCRHTNNVSLQSFDCLYRRKISRLTSTDPTSDWAADADDTGDIDDTGDTGEPDTGDEDPADLALAGHWADSGARSHD